MSDKITSDFFVFCLNKADYFLQKLESQLRDVAYGTRQYKLMPPADDAVSILPLILSEVGKCVLPCYASRSDDLQHIVLGLSVFKSVRTSVCKLKPCL